jgi:hypothetical protein
MCVYKVAHHRKKLQGRKLDYDCKKRKQQSGGGIPEKEIKQVVLFAWCYHYFIQSKYCTYRYCTVLYFIGHTIYSTGIFFNALKG